MDRKDIKSIAKQKIKENLSLNIVVFLVIGLIIALLSPTGIGVLIVTGPIMVCWSLFLLMQLRGEKQNLRTQ